MGSFIYLFLSSSGKKQRAQIEADSIGEAKEKLRKQGVLVLSLKKKYIFFSLKRKSLKLSSMQLQQFTLQLYQLLKAGLPLFEALSSLEEQQRREKIHPFYIFLCEKIKNGSTLSTALAEESFGINSIYRATISAGELVGALDLSFERLCLLLEKKEKLKKQMLSALLYPAILLGFSAIVISLLFFFVIPSLKNLFEGREVNRFTSTVFFLSHFLKNNGVVLGSILALIIFTFSSFFKTTKGKFFLHTWMLKFPIIKQLTIQTVCARFCRSLSILVQGGVPLLQSLQYTRNSLGNRLMEKAIEETEKKLIEGSRLSFELKKYPFFPSLLTRMVTVGEEGGELGTILQKLAELYEEETEKNLIRFTTLLQPLILIFMGAIVGGLMLGILLPLSDVQSFLNS